MMHYLQVYFLVVSGFALGYACRYAVTAVNKKYPEGRRSGVQRKKPARKWPSARPYIILGWLLVGAISMPCGNPFL